MIDMHAHWRPAELIDALRARTKEPRIVRNQDGVEVLKSRIGEEPVSKAFDDVEFHLARMDRQGVSTVEQSFGMDSRIARHHSSPSNGRDLGNSDRAPRLAIIVN